ncbi:MAG: hypothetical protein FWB89_01170 [Treponema sp.]|nr:hypothetical protein [Treponema sp.]
MILLILFLLFQSTPASCETLPDWFIPLRDAVYEQKLSTAQIELLYREVSSKAKSVLSGAEQQIMLSRCEYFMGRAYSSEEKKAEAIKHFNEGIKYAENAMKVKESAQAWVMQAENISQSCLVQPTSYAIANGLKVEKYSKNAIVINPRYAAAQIMVAARWVFAPSPLHNYPRAIQMLTDIINNSDMEKDDKFNVYMAMGYVYLKQKNNVNANLWFAKASEIYPSNKYLQSLTEGI